MGNESNQANRLRTWRRSNGFTPTELDRILSVPYGSVRKWEQQLEPVDLDAVGREFGAGLVGYILGD